jgi:predicted negative regulator of RcsB-dependent stress response
MATSLDLQEQEQLEDLKAFWKQYGNLITWLLILVFGALAAWNGWNLYQRKQAEKAAELYEQLERAAQGGDATLVGKAFSDLRDRFPRTVQAQQGGLVAAKVQFDKGQADAARSSLAWLADNAQQDEYKTVARLRLAALLAEQQQYDAALKQLDGATAPEFAGLVADRRGDILMAQGKKDEAKAAYQASFKALDDTVEYRRLVEAKLTALGGAPAASAAAAAKGAQ